MMAGAYHPAQMSRNKKRGFILCGGLNRTIQRLLLCLIPAALCVIGGSVARADWPEFRGPWGDGHVSAPGATNLIGLPLRWSETNNIKWKTEIPHRGWSTPVVIGNQVWL